jgi:hypothetical protein
VGAFPAFPAATLEPAIVIAVAAHKAFIIVISGALFSVANNSPPLQSKEREREFE